MVVSPPSHTLWRSHRSGQLEAFPPRGEADGLQQGTVEKGKGRVETDHKARHCCGEKEKGKVDEDGPQQKRKDL